MQNPNQMKDKLQVKPPMAGGVPQEAPSVTTAVRRVLDDLLHFEGGKIAAPVVGSFLAGASAATQKEFVTTVKSAAQTLGAHDILNSCYAADETLAKQPVPDYLQTKYGQSSAREATRSVGDHRHNVYHVYQNQQERAEAEKALEQYGAQRSGYNRKIEIGDQYQEYKANHGVLQSDDIVSADAPQWMHSGKRAVVKPKEQSPLYQEEEPHPLGSKQFAHPWAPDDASEAEMPSHKVRQVPGKNYKPPQPGDTHRHAGDYRAVEHGIAAEEREEVFERIDTFGVERKAYPSMPVTGEEKYKPGHGIVQHDNMTSAGVPDWMKATHQRRVPVAGRRKIEEHPLGPNRANHPWAALHGPPPPEAPQRKKDAPRKYRPEDMPVAGKQIQAAPPPGKKAPTDISPPRGAKKAGDFRAVNQGISYDDKDEVMHQIDQFGQVKAGFNRQIDPNEAYKAGHGIMQNDSIVSADAPAWMKSSQNFLARRQTEENLRNAYQQQQLQQQLDQQHQHQPHPPNDSARGTPRNYNQTYPPQGNTSARNTPRSQRSQHGPGGDTARQERALSRVAELEEELAKIRGQSYASVHQSNGGNQALPNNVTAGDFRAVNKGIDSSRKDEIMQQVQHFGENQKAGFGRQVGVGEDAQQYRAGHGIMQSDDIVSADAPAWMQTSARAKRH